MSGRSRSISFGFGKDALDAGLTHIFHEARNLNQVYVALTIISKLLSVFAVFLAYDLLQTLTPTSLALLVNFWTSVVLCVLHKPFTGSAQVAFTRKHIAFCILFGVGSALLSIGWATGLWFCGPLRSVLVHRHAEYIVLSVVGAIFFREQAQQSATRRRGAVLFVAALVILFVFDTTAPSTQVHTRNEDRSSNLEEAQMQKREETEPSESSYSSRIGIILLVIFTLFELGLNAAGRRLAPVVGGVNRLHAISSIAAFTVLIPFGLPALIFKVHGVAGWLEALSVSLFVALAISIIDSYLSSLSQAQLGVARTARFAEFGTLISALILACVWHAQADATAFRPLTLGKQNTDDRHDVAAQVQPGVDGASHGVLSVSPLGGAALTSIGLLIVAALSLTGAPPKAGQSGRFIGYSSGGLPLYTVSNDAERRGAGGLSWLSTIFQFVRANLRNTIDDSRSRRILIYLCLNLSFTVVELVYGVWSNSLGLISDSMHMLFDCSALLLALIAATIARWKPTRTHSFGFTRVEVLSGFVNALFLLLIGVSILFAAVRRLFDTPRINADRLITVSVLGLVVNLVGIVLLRDMHVHHGHAHAHAHAPETRKHKHSHSHDRHANHNHDHDHDHDHDRCDEHAHGHDHHSHHHHNHGNANLRGVFLHVLADTLGSVGVIVSSLCIQQFGWYWTDPVCSMFIACLVLTSIYPLLIDTAEVLVLRTPRHLEYAWTRALAKIERLPGVVVVSRQHLWQHSHEVLCCALHVRLRADANESFVAQHVSDTIRSLGVIHSAVQFEHETTTDHVDDRQTLNAPLGWINAPTTGNQINNLAGTVPVHYAAKTNINGSPQRPPGVQPNGGSSAMRRAAPAIAADPNSQAQIVSANVAEFPLSSAIPRDSQDTALSSSFYVVEHADVKDV